MPLPRKSTNKHQQHQKPSAGSTVYSFSAVVGSHVSPADALEAVTEDTGEWPYRNVKKTFGVDSHFGP